MEYHGYKDCVKLENRTTRLIVSGACGGRVLEYSLNGKNAIFLKREHDGWICRGARRNIDPCGGRLDIGPEFTIPKHPGLYVGRWETERTGNASARMTSIKDKATGVQLIRDFILAPDSSKLTVTQTIRNISNKMVHYCHWSRTLAPGGGLCVIPLTPDSRFPKKYVMYQKNLINFRPKDDNVILRKNAIFITGAPRFAKLGFDSYAGWLAYLTRNDLLFTKEFPVYPERVYNELTAITVCVYCTRNLCELEPIGPQENIAPGKSAAYTETWRLNDYPFPKDKRPDIAKLKATLTH